MKEIQRILKNLSVLSLARIVSMFFGFFYTVYTTRYLGPANYGILAFALALNGIFGVIANFGLDPLTVREVARNKNLAGKYLANGIVLKLLFGCLTFLIVFVVVNLLGYPEITKKVVYLITIFTILGGINNLFYSIYQAFEKMEFISIGQILKSVLLLIFAIVGIKFNFDVIYFALIYLIVGFIELIYNLVITILWKPLKLGTMIDFEFWKVILAESSWFAIAAFTTSLYYYFDSVMISYMKGNFEVGIYNAAYRLANIVLIIPQIYFLTVYPKLSNTYIKNLNTFKILSEISITIMWILSFIVGILGFIFSNIVVTFIYGKEYLDAVPIFKIIIWSISLAYITIGLGNILDAIGHQKLRFYIVLFSCILNIILNYFFIPIYGAFGAAISTLIARIVILVTFSIVVFKITYIFPFIKLENIKKLITFLKSYIFS